MIQFAAKNPERQYDFTITGTIPIAFVRVRYAPHIFIELAEVAKKFHQDFLRLRAITREAAISLELWIRSKHGTWRFFRLTATGIAEIDRDGRLVAGK